MKKVRVSINTGQEKSHINRELYGHFSEHLGRCIYEGIFVGEDSTIPNTKGMRNDVVSALKDIKIPVLRWPGGCFADEYHWKDGIGEKSTRKRMVNTHWGGLVEDNSFGTHEFMELCEQLGCEPYIAGNLGSGTVQELSEWVEYMTFEGVSPMAELRRQNGREKPWRLKYLGIGNENWGCGGNMRPEYYADEYRRYQTYCRNYNGNELYKIACGPNSDDYNWTDKLLSIVNEWHTKAITLHYYTLPTGDWNHKGSATEFTQEEYYQTIKRTLYMEELIQNHGEIMKKHNPSGSIGLIIDEWGCWYDVEEGSNPGFLYQQNTMRDAMVAAVNLNLFNQHSDQVVMANLAQVVNVLQAVILTEGEKMVLTPTYHVFKMFVDHQDAMLVESELEEVYTTYGDTTIPAISESVSVDKEGNLFLTLANCSLSESYELETRLNGFTYQTVEASILTGPMAAHNTFEHPKEVGVKFYDGYHYEEDLLTVILPPCSVVAIKLWL